jgi:hypothetical protein
MIEKSLTIGSTVALPKPELDTLMADLRTNGFQTVGPHFIDESIIYTTIEGIKDLPRGFLSEQDPGLEIVNGNLKRTSNLHHIMR